MSRDALILNLFIQAQRWTPFVSEPNPMSISDLKIIYKNETYLIDNAYILCWIDTDIESIEIPEKIYVDLIGSSPEYLSTRTEICNTYKIFDTLPSIDDIDQGRISIKDVYILCITLNYMRSYKAVWDLQKCIYQRRYLLPDHWRSLGGIYIRDTDEPVMKWNGDISPYTYRQFNGMYLPYNISSTAEERVMISSDIRYLDEMRIIERSQDIQDLSFDIYPSNISIDDRLINAIAVVAVGRDISHMNSISDDDIYNICIADTSQIRDRLAILPNDRCRSVASKLISVIPISLVLSHWDIFSITSENIPSVIIDVINSSDRIEYLEQMDESSLVYIASLLDIDIPYDGSDIDISGLICLLDEQFTRYMDE